MSHDTETEGYTLECAQCGGSGRVRIKTDAEYAREDDPDPESKTWAQGFDDGVIAVLERLTRRAEVCPQGEAVALLDARDNIRKRLIEEPYKG